MDTLDLFLMWVLEKMYDPLKEKWGPVAAFFIVTSFALVILAGMLLMIILLIR